MNKNKDLEDIYTKILEEGMFDRFKANAQGLKAGAKQIGAGFKNMWSGEKGSSGIKGTFVAGSGDVGKAANTQAFSTRINDFIEKANTEMNNISDDLQNASKEDPNIADILQNLNKLISGLRKITPPSANTPPNMNQHPPLSKVSAPAPAPKVSAPAPKKNTREQLRKEDRKKKLKALRSKRYRDKIKERMLSKRRKDAPYDNLPEACSSFKNFCKQTNAQIIREGM